MCYNCVTTTTVCSFDPMIASPQSPILKLLESPLMYPSFPHEETFTKQSGESLIVKPKVNLSKPISEIQNEKHIFNSESPRLLETNLSSESCQKRVVVSKTETVEREQTDQFNLQLGLSHWEENQQQRPTCHHLMIQYILNKDLNSSTFSVWKAFDISFSNNDTRHFLQNRDKNIQMYQGNNVSEK